MHYICIFKGWRPTCLFLRGPERQVLGMWHTSHLILMYTEVKRKRDLAVLPAPPHPTHKSHLNTKPHTRNTDSTASKPTSCSLY